MLRFLRLGRTAALAAIVFMAAGCGNGFLDPTEMGTFEHAEPLAVPILDNLEIGETPLEQFAGASEVGPEDLEVSAEDYVIGRSDLVNISITDLTGPGVETLITRRVSETGNVSLPLVGQIETVGLTEAELEQRIIEAYQQAQIIQDAQVAVTVVEARGRTFSVSGAVNNPNQFALIEADTRVLDALVLSGDTTTPLIKELYILRKRQQEPRRQAGQAPQPPAEQPRDVLAPREPTTAPAEQIEQPFEFQEIDYPQDVRVIRIPLQDLRRGDLRYNAVIRPEDMIIAPHPVIGQYYMGGHVARIGAYSLTGLDITLKQAVISAGMLDGLAIPRRTELIRRLGPNREVFVSVELDKIFAGQQPDFYLKPEDQIMVGTNAAAPFLAALRGAFRATYGFGFIYDRNFYDGDDNDN